MKKERTKCRTAPTATRKTKEPGSETDQSPTSAVLGDGGIYSSIDDLAKWDRALREHTLLSEAEMQPALTPVHADRRSCDTSEGRKSSATASDGFSIRTRATSACRTTARRSASEPLSSAFRTTS